MSGTSADGIDAALVKFQDAQQIEVICTLFSAFPKSLQDEINRLAYGNAIDPEHEAAKKMDALLADRYARAAIQLIAASGIDPKQVAAIANHGQTVAHRPDAKRPESIQLGDPQKIADLTGLPVIARFRQADLAHGGQGAPLMPAFHQAISTNNEAASLVLNLGGIANITAINCPDLAEVVGFDTGPANTLLNQWINRVKGIEYDSNGQWGASGVIDQELLDSLLAEPYFDRDFPKSTGPDYFNLDWLQQRMPQELGHYRTQDVQATLVELTALSIAKAIQQLKVHSGKIYICGGGVHNHHLLSRINSALPEFELSSTSDLGVPPDWVEAAGFAWLGYCNLKQLTSNLPSVTGASKKLVLGEQFLPQ